MKLFKLSFIFLFISTNILFCRILRVPQDYPKIQDAINASAHMDTVLVSEGIYYENINYRKKNIVVASNFIYDRKGETITKTIIDGSTPLIPDSGSVVMIVSGEDSTAVLEGFTIRKGSGTIALEGKWIEGGGILIENSSKPVIKNNIIIDNTTIFRKAAQDGGGGGISIIRSCPTIINNIIMCNTAGYAGGIVLNWSGGIIRNNIIYNNYAAKQYGTGGIMVWDIPSMQPQIVENNTIVGNTAKQITGGMSIDGAANPDAKNNIIWGNRQASGKQTVNPARGSFNDIEDFSNSNTISVYPEFIENSFMLADVSPCIDAGDTSILYNDLSDPLNSEKALFPAKGNLRNDMGSYGGKYAKDLPPLINFTNLYVFRTNITGIKCEVTKDTTFKVGIKNMSTHKLLIDSVISKYKSEITFDCPKKAIGLFLNDSISVTYKPTTAGNITDTILIYCNGIEPSKPKMIIMKATGIPFVGVKENQSTGFNYKLYQNYPNPFNPETIISYQIPASLNPSQGGTLVPVTLKIYDLLGKEVATLVNEDKAPGYYEVKFSAGSFGDASVYKGLSSGVYFAKLTAGDFTEIMKMIYQK